MTDKNNLIRQNSVKIPAIAGAMKMIQEARMDYNFSEVLKDRPDVPKGTGESIVSVLTRNHAEISRMIRAATRMNGLAARPGDITATMVIGRGMVPLCQDQELMKLYKRWSKNAGADGLGDFRFVQEQMWREYFNMGEGFGYLRYRKDRNSTALAVPLQVSVLSTEMVPTDVSFDTVNKTKGGQIIKNGETTHYYVYKTHPGDRSDWIASASKDVFKVQAKNMLHVMRQLEPGAIRGESALVRSLVEIHDIKKYLNAELVRKVLVSNIAYWVEIPDLTEEEKERMADVFLDSTTGKYVDSDGNEVEAPESPAVRVPDAGSVVTLTPGAKINKTEPAESGNSFSPFLRQVGLQLAVSLNIPYEYLMLDMAGVQDRIYKGISQQFERQVEMWRADFASMFLVPIWNRFVRLAVAEGKWKVPAGMKIEDFLDIDWAGQPFPNLHRAQEVASWKTEIDEGFATWSDIVRRQGDDPERIRRERLKDLVSDIKMGLAEVPVFWSDEQVKEYLELSDDQLKSFRERSSNSSENLFAN